MSERLHKYMARCGVAARRKCEILIAEGRVTVNGNTVTSMGITVDPRTDRVTVDGKTIQPPHRYVYFALNKPAGVVVTASDSHGVKTVLDIMEEVTERIFPVGRLDLDTEGLLLLTNDGELANRLMHPRYHLEKEYHACVTQQVNDHNLRWLSRGIVIDGKRTIPARIRLRRKGGKNWCYQVIIREGRKRQIRRMFRAVGSPVQYLKRMAIGPVRIGRLKTGEYRPLTKKEIRDLKQASGLIGGSRGKNETRRGYERRG